MFTHNCRDTGKIKQSRGVSEKWNISHDVAYTTNKAKDKLILSTHRDIREVMSIT